MSTAGDQLAFFGEGGDGAARAAIREQLDATLFVEAGAGTGKTAALVDRVVALVTGEAPIPVESIAAITFTEKAASELRDRIRSALENCLRSDRVGPGVQERARLALDNLDAAAICTLHAFAQRILTEFPIEAGLPPRIRVRDEIASMVAFDARWRRFLDELLEDPELETTILLALAAGARLEQLRAVAEVFDDNWDLLDRIGHAPPVPVVDAGPWLDDLDATTALAADCRMGDDRLALRLGELAEYGAKLRAALDDVDRVRLLRAEKPSFKVRNSGRQGNWPDIDQVRECVVRLGEQREAMVARVLDAVIRRLAVAIAGCTRDSVAERREAGELEFHDLLVLARTLLRDEQHGARARDRLRERYRCILIDEFQDTDPIQVDLATLLGSNDPSRTTGGERHWSELPVDAGRLFFVGDPKQSIYRFRRADISTFLDAEAKFGAHAPVVLTCNYRTVEPVVAWINHVFTDLIQPFPGSQPEYRSLQATRAAAPAGPPVALLGKEPFDEGDAAEQREREADDVAAAVRRAIDEGWSVCDRETNEWRAPRLGDICILLPARTSLPYLEQALDAAGIPARAETSSLVYATREVRDLLATLRAIDDPSDHLSLITALRSPLFGCGDDDLFRFKVVHGGWWDMRRPPPDSVLPGDPVGDALRYLGALHERRTWLAPSELLERVVRDRRVLEFGALGGRFRDVARRLRFLVDQARAFADAEGGGLRDYLRWAELQGAEGARVVETVLPETDDDAVRIMTIHGAKGLEFPIVVLSGMTTAAQARRAGVQVLFPPSGGYELKLGRDVQTEEFELHRPIDEQMGFHEKLRLLYVACTRARDHLVVSVHRKVRSRPEEDRAKWTHAELLWAAAQGAGWASLEPADEPAWRDAAPAHAAEPSVHAPTPEQWAAEHAQAFARGAQRRFVAATALAARGAPAAADDPGLRKEGRDLELPPWNKGRYGTAIGRAVHAVMQTIDLATCAGLDDAVAAQAAAEGVLGHEGTIAALARAALNAPHVRRAAALPHWRELYVAVPLEDMTLEGYVDLCYRDTDGLVIVDYKTDAVRVDGDDAVFAERLAHYRIQAAAYALAVEAATGERVVRCALCFLDPNAAQEVEFDGEALQSAIAEVRAALRAEHDDPSPLPPPVLADA